MKVNSNCYIATLLHCYIDKLPKVFKMPDNLIAKQTIL